VAVSRLTGQTINRATISHGPHLTLGPLTGDVLASEPGGDGGRDGFGSVPDRLVERDVEHRRRGGAVVVIVTHDGRFSGVVLYRWPRGRAHDRDRPRLEGEVPSWAGSCGRWWWGWRWLG
jgi:hypothetical protein